jgi:hypothetical protein
MRSRNSMIILSLAIGGAISLGGCATTGEGTKQVTCETVKFVWLSRKDTPGTIRQVTANNGAWVAFCGDPGKAPPGIDKLPAIPVKAKKPSFIERWRGRS